MVARTIMACCCYCKETGELLNKCGSELCKKILKHYATNGVPFKSIHEIKDTDQK